MLKSETNTEMETNFWILSIDYFFGITNVRVGGKILGSIGNTHIFSLALLTTIGEGCCDGMVGGFTSTYTIITYSL